MKFHQLLKILRHLKSLSTIRGFTSSEIHQLLEYGTQNPKALQREYK